MIKPIGRVVARKTIRKTCDGKDIDGNTIVKGTEEHIAVDVANENVDQFFKENEDGSFDVLVDVVRENKDKVHWNNFSSQKNVNYTDEILEEFCNDVNWRHIAYHSQIPEKSLIKYIDHMDLRVVMAMQDLPESLIVTMKDKVNWETLCSTKAFSEEFILEHQDKLGWEDISFYQRMSIDFLRENKDKVDWESFSRRVEKTPDEVISEFKNVLVVSTLIECQNLSENVLRELSSAFSNQDWTEISKSQKLSEGFIAGYEGKVDWENIAGWQDVSYQFAKRFEDRAEWDWDGIARKSVSLMDKLTEENTELRNEIKDLKIKLEGV